MIVTIMGELSVQLIRTREVTSRYCDYCVTTDSLSRDQNALDHVLSWTLCQSVSLTLCVFCVCVGLSHLSKIRFVIGYLTN